jgi:predicted RNA-binding Zn-ribbon protein involved in translation (DUF1610 family)
VEKYGVEVERRPHKEASREAVPTCPRCGTALPQSEEVNVPRCPECGTEPFEVT